MSEEVLQIGEERREVKSKEERERYSQLNTPKLNCLIREEPKLSYIPC